MCEQAAVHAVVRQYRLDGTAPDDAVDAYAVAAGIAARALDDELRAAVHARFGKRAGERLNADERIAHFVDLGRREHIRQHDETTFEEGFDLFVVEPSDGVYQGATLWVVTILRYTRARPARPAICHIPGVAPGLRRWNRGRTRTCGSRRTKTVGRASPTPG